MSRLELGVSSGIEESLLGGLPVGDGPEVVEVSLLVVGYVEIVGVSAYDDRQSGVGGIEGMIWGGRTYSQRSTPMMTA